MAHDPIASFRAFTLGLAAAVVTAGCSYELDAPPLTLEPAMATGTEGTIAIVPTATGRQEMAVDGLFFPAFFADAVTLDGHGEPMPCTRGEPRDRQLFGIVVDQSLPVAWRFDDDALTLILVNRATLICPIGTARCATLEVGAWGERRPSWHLDFWNTHVDAASIRPLTMRFCRSPQDPDPNTVRPDESPS